MAESILVCFAVPQEAAPFQKRVTGSKNVHVLVTGMGEKNTRETLLRKWDADQGMRWKAVITCGYAGGLQPRWNRGDVLVSTEDATLLSAFESAGAMPGKFMASDRILINPEEKAAAARRSGCDAVEMESSVVHALCRARGIPAATVRVISDALQDSLPLDFNLLLNAKSELPLSRILGALVKRPSVIPGLIRLGKHSSLAAKRLADVLERGVARLG